MKETDIRPLIPPQSIFFSGDRLKAVPLLQFFCVRHWCHMFVLAFFIISPLSGAFERLCFVIMAFPGYLNSCELPHVLVV